ncbi:MAG: alpha/beta fold hydrolase [Abyssibacter sp.]|uniref:alpha/beta fold hydrolase n=1 Tax=Abyssibacter sp. TaxID=2320200 RepID=UPI00321AE862
MPTLMECGSFSHAGARLAYSLAGPASGPRIVLMHGILMDSLLNRDLAEALAQAGYRVALLDLQGHGRSDKTTRAQDLRIDLFGQQAIALLDHLGWSRAVLGGVSLGAITALHAAVQAPNRVNGLFLEMPVMERAAPAAALMLVPLMVGARYAARPWRFGARQLRRLPRPRRGLWQSLLNTVSQDPEHLAAVIHGVLSGPVVPPLRERLRLSMPALVIGHAGDWLHNLKDARALSQELPNAELIIARSPLELRTRPTRLMPEILRFFERTQADPQTSDQQQA